jgi:hypothetical protein
MGWAGGSDVMTSIIHGAKKRFPHDPEIRRDIYEITIWALDGHDWDTHDECMGQDIEFDKALEKLRPERRD